MNAVVSNNRSILFEKALGRFFKVVLVNHLAEGFNFSTPSFSVSYDKEPHGLKGVFVDFFFWSLDLYYYPAGDSKDNLLNNFPEAYEVVDYEQPELTKDNVALRDYR